MKRAGSIFSWIGIGLLSVSLLSGCNPKNPDPQPQYTPEIVNAITLGKSANTYDTRDKILLNAVSKAKTIADIKALAMTANSYDVRDQILQEGVALARTPEDYIILAKSANTYNVRDQILVKGAKICTTIDSLLMVVKSMNDYDTRDQTLLSRLDLARSVEDFQRLAATANRYAVRDQILQKGAQKLAMNKISLPTDGTVLAYEEPAKGSGNQERQQAHEAMLKAQKAYTEAVSRNAPPQQVLELNKVFQAKKKAYEALGGL